MVKLNILPLPWGSLRWLLVHRFIIIAQTWRVFYMVKPDTQSTNPSGLCYVSNEDIQGTELRVIYMVKLNTLPINPPELSDDSSVIGYNHSKSWELFIWLNLTLNLQTRQNSPMTLQWVIIDRFEMFYVFLNGISFTPMLYAFQRCLSSIPSPPEGLL